MKLSTEKINKLKTNARKELLKRIRIDGISDSFLCDKLNLLPAGLEIFKEREDWSFEDIITLADVLGLKVNLTIFRDEVISSDGFQKMFENKPNLNTYLYGRK